MDKFNELLELYGLTEEDIEFEHDSLSDEDLEAAFTEAFGDAEEFKKKKKCSEEEPAEDSEEDYAGCKKKKKCSDDEEDEPDDEEDYAGCKKKKKCSVNTESGTVEFELSFDDIRMALYNLLAENMDTDSYGWICETYDDHFIYQKESYANGYEAHYFKQNYSKDGDNIIFSGDPVEVFTEFVTESEKTALDMIRSQYDELKAFKEQYDADQSKAEKEAVLYSAEYSEIKDSDEFKALVNDMDKYTVDELKVKADLLFAAAMKKKFNFEAKDEKKPKSVGINFNTKSGKRKQAYSGLFDD